MAALAAIPYTLTSPEDPNTNSLLVFKSSVINKNSFSFSSDLALINLNLIWALVISLMAPWKEDKGTVASSPSANWVENTMLSFPWMGWLGYT